MNLSKEKKTVRLDIINSKSHGFWPRMAKTELIGLNNQSKISLLQPKMKE